MQLSQHEYIDTIYWIDAWTIYQYYYCYNIGSIILKSIPNDLYSFWSRIVVLIISSRINDHLSKIKWIQMFNIFLWLVIFGSLRWFAFSILDPIWLLPRLHIGQNICWKMMCEYERNGFVFNYLNHTQKKVHLRIGCLKLIERNCKNSGYLSKRFQEWGRILGR